MDQVLSKLILRNFHETLTKNERDILSSLNFALQRQSVKLRNYNLLIT